MQSQNGALSGVTGYLVQCKMDITEMLNGAYYAGGVPAISSDKDLGRSIALITPKGFFPAL